MTGNRGYEGAAVPVGNPLEPAPSTTAELQPSRRQRLFALAREIATLRAENGRYRRALRKIADCPNPDSVENCHDRMWVIAQEALRD